MILKCDVLKVGEGFQPFSVGSINGVPIRVLVDTGSTNTIFHRGLFGLKKDKIILIDYLSLPPCICNDRLFNFIDLRRINNFYEFNNIPTISGILGMDLIKEFELFLDFNSL